MNLWIDDIRDPSDIVYVNMYNIPSDVVWAKNYDDALELILNNEINWIAFDNDLGDDKDRQGKHLFSVLEERVVNGYNPMFIAVFQTSNSVAKNQMILGYTNLVRLVKTGRI